jgi:TolB-like protein
MTEEAPSGKTRIRSGQVAIITIGLVGLLFFGGMELLKRQLHSTPAAPVSSVVVLPAKVLGSADMDYLTDAVPGTLSALLAQVQGLETKTPPGSIAVDRFQGDLQKIAAVYQVSAILTSVIAVEGDAVTLDLQLVHPETHSVLWSNQYLGKMTNYNELLRQAADGAGHALQPGSSRVTSTAGLASNSEAELAYRKGLYSFARFNQLHENADFDGATAAFKRALQLDPALANAAADLDLLYAASSKPAGR